MNQALRVITCMWLGLVAFTCWIGLAIVGFFCAFSSDTSFFTRVTPIIGITIVICIIRSMVLVWKSNPFDFLVNTYNSFEAKLPK